MYNVLVHPSNEVILDLSGGATNASAKVTINGFCAEVSPPRQCDNVDPGWGVMGSDIFALKARFADRHAEETELTIETDMFWTSKLYERAAKEGKSMAMGWLNIHAANLPANFKGGRALVKVIVLFNLPESDPEEIPKDPADLFIEPLRNDFIATDLNPSPHKNFWLSNTGIEDLEIKRITFSGPGRQFFSLSAPPAFPHLLSNASLSVTVQCTGIVDSELHRAFMNVVFAKGAKKSVPLTAVKSP